ncbi:MAG: error-prone DNA polymerase [Thiohalomonadales bacterium]
MASLPEIDSVAAYAELHCLSNYSFLRGASFPEELIQQAVNLGYKALAITDECSLSGVVRAHVAAKQTSLKLLIGSEFILADGLKLVLLATSRGSYGRLSHLISMARQQTQKGRYHLSREMLAEHIPKGCIALWLPQRNGRLADSNELLWLQNLFPDKVWISIALLLTGRDSIELEKLRLMGQSYGVPLCASGDVHMHLRRRKLLQDIVTAIRKGGVVKDLGFALYANAERYLRPRRRLQKIYPIDLLSETVSIAEQCRFCLDELRYEYPHELVPARHTAASWLTMLIKEGAQKRWPNGIPTKVRALIRHELALICELQYEHYFLTVHDIVRYARQQGILCQGRGSAANSVVCYCLEITEVDPARMQLLFERFISKERDEPPDIDVDFEHERREEVIQYIYQKYGRDRAAIAATIISYQPRSAIRDVGKALGMSVEQVDRLAKSFNGWQGLETAQQQVRESGFSPDNPVIKQLLEIVQTIIGFPRHLSQHVGGFIISAGKLSHLVPIENAAMAKRTVIQWEKNDLEALGLLKIDVLALGMLTAIRKALSYISQYSNSTLGLADIPAEDPEVYKMIQQADTIGVFQIESRAQMSMLPRLRPNNYYDLVIQIAIVRPGPIQGDMVHPYLARRCGREKVEYHNEAIKAVLQRTLGVPIFQEQVMQISIVAAGFTPGEADQLRRSMAAWKKKGGLEKFETKLISGMRDRGYPESFAQQIFKQIKGFGDYGFPESHSASFALLAYASSWLKCYHPAAFTCALLNSQPMGFYAPSQLIQDVQRHGVDVLPIDINASAADCSLNSIPVVSTANPKSHNKTVIQLRLGLRLVKGLSAKGLQAIVAQREQGVYVSVQDLAARTKLHKNDIENLAAADVFKQLVGDRHRAFWQVSGIEPANSIFANPQFNEVAVMLSQPDEGKNIIADYATMGLSLRRHPLALLRTLLQREQILTASALWQQKNATRVKVAGLVICRQRPASANNVMFVTLEDETGQCNIIVWPKIAERQHKALLKASLLLVCGKLQQHDGVLHVIAENLQDYSHYLGELSTISRDFH